MRAIGDLHPAQVHKREETCEHLWTYTPLIRPAFVNRDEGRPSLLRLEVPRTFNLSKLGELKKPKATYML